MLYNRGNILPAEARESAVLIVGAGAAGIALAIRLARTGKSVTLLEAGPAEPPIDYRRANDARQSGRAHDGIVSGRMKALGGTTRLWGGQLTLFSRADLEGNAKTGRPAWPIAYEEYLDWVDAALGLLEVPFDHRAGNAAWRAASGADPTLGGPDLIFGTNLWLRQPDFVRFFGKELRTLAGLHVVTNCEVAGLTFSAEGRVDGVETGDGTFRGGQVVLACGTFEIARLLLRAAAVSPGCPFAGNPHLGKWFIDHLHGVAGEVHQADTARIGRLFDHVNLQGYRLGVKVRASDALCREYGIGNGNASIFPRMSLREIPLEVLALLRRIFTSHGSESRFQALRGAFALSASILPMAWRYLVRRRAALPLSGGILVGLEIEQLPCPESYIALDPDQPPSTARPMLHWALDGREMKTIQAVAFAFRDGFAREGLGRVELDPRIVAGDPAYLDTTHDAYHQMGGARMGASATEGVVDGNLKVFGTTNLHVLGAAVFPSGSFANPTLTVLALAMRLAERLAKGSPP